MMVKLQSKARRRGIREHTNQSINQSMQNIGKNELNLEEYLTEQQTKNYRSVQAIVLEQFLMYNNNSKVR